MCVNEYRKPLILRFYTVMTLNSLMCGGHLYDLPLSLTRENIHTVLVGVIEEECEGEGVRVEFEGMGMCGRQVYI